MKVSEATRKLTTMAMLTAISIVLVASFISRCAGGAMDGI